MIKLPEPSHGVGAIGSILMMVATLSFVGVACLLFLPLLGIVTIGGLVLLFSGLAGDFSLAKWPLLPLIIFPASLFLSVWVVVDGIPLINEPTVRPFVTLALRSAALIGMSYYVLQIW